MDFNASNVFDNLSSVLLRQSSMRILFIFVLPCFAAENAYKIWWYTSGGTRIPFLGNFFVSNAVACILELCSWFYRTVVFFLLCIFFRLICYLQILRLQDFAIVFHVDSDVKSILKERLRIRRHLRMISHRYRAFILCALILITVSQFASLLLCSLRLVAGLLILQRSAARITQKAQAVTALSSKWHVCATIDSFEASETETPQAQLGEDQVFVDVSSDLDEAGDEEDDIDIMKLVSSYANSTISFQNRQAIVTYFESNRAGITVYGFMLDRSSLHTIFGVVPHALDAREDSWTLPTYPRLIPS